MIPATKKLYNASLKNNEFEKAMLQADGDEKPSYFASKIEQILYATMYYGWLVGKYGNDWKSYT